MVDNKDNTPWYWSEWIPNTQKEDKIPTVLLDMDFSDWEYRVYLSENIYIGRGDLYWETQNADKLGFYPVTYYRYKIYLPLTGYEGVDADEDNVLPEGLLETSKQEEVEDTKEWTNEHYNFWYNKPITDYDIESGYVNIKVDPYFVNKLWGLNTKDDTGVLFHQLKTLSRFGDKNSVEREIKALHGQVVRLAELHNVELQNVELGDK